ncbi:stage III sporulation protein AF [Alteribacter aurantiacus]|uniref:stage III sporulation protein AF n=1 Tax=Alteribacter aurantiacus TaxID=254410 RepID=UPI000409635E|nr:stage III sporulation protein AF [Alteribacter aurantiacus]
MAYVTEWITNIILLILFAAILELLLPNSSLQRYVKLVVGLMVLMVMIQPILSVFKTDPEDWLASMSEWVDGEMPNEESSIERKKVEIEKGKLAYISEQVAVQLMNQAREPLQQQYGVVPVEVEVELETFDESENVLEGLSKVRAVLTPRTTEGHEDGDSQTVTLVKPVVIEPVGEKNAADEKELEVMADPDEMEEIKTFLSVHWQIPSEQIELELKGGEKNGGQ